MRVGVVGLGGIGTGAARGVCAAGFSTTIYDVRPEAVAQLASEAAVAESVAAASEASDVLLVAVWDDEQVREVIAGAAGVIAAASVPQVVVVLSTTTLETILWVQQMLTPRGASAVDCGVAGGVKALANRSIVAMAGGDEAAFGYAMPVLAAFADPVIRLGPLGSGMAAKLARNMITYAERVVVWEAINLAAAADVDPRAFIEVIKATDRWNSHTSLLDRGFLPGQYRDGDPADAAQAAAYARKDLGAALELGRQLGAPLELTAIANALYGPAVGVEPLPGGST
jgi:3-hydroxyisobutyrate dehydrogenase